MMQDPAELCWSGGCGVSEDTGTLAGPTVAGSGGGDITTERKDGDGSRYRRMLGDLYIGMCPH